MVHERQQGVHASLQQQYTKPQLPVMSVTEGESRLCDGAHHGEQDVIRQHGREQKGEQCEEHCPKQELVDVIVPRVDPVSKHVVPFT